ncbi:NAD(P)-binding protein [Delitschia confertaspora ATCC 74209]|uniref:D-xylose 1-dehydrogenase (NADP(+), D-xylono-1,5-lactone-forming) n=1 Tax=Delitschia confertaspora ATCC 74209 TaxID=1513339 RepID=A0A9P4MSN4_9PLEO|nr:NAD(P)-binding protein [Delitschia confertaspora ATCC 74209]
MTSEPFTLRWGILATGGIAKTFTKDLLIPPATRNAHDINHKLVAVASSNSVSRAQAFLHEINAPSTSKAYGSYTDLVSDPNVDIIYVATPHSHHYQHARLCLEAGKHVLCEKAFTVNAAQAQTLVDLAKDKGLFLMEAVWTRYFPVAREIRERVRKGEVGDVKRVWADLSFWNDVEGVFGGDEGGHRMVNIGLAGGALLDLGIYSLTWVFQILYHILPESQRSEPIVSSQIAKYAGTGCDEMTTIVLHFPKTGAHGVATTSIRVPTTPTPVIIQGTLGTITLPHPIYRPTSYKIIPNSSFESSQPPNSSQPQTSLEEETITHGVEGGGHGMFYEADECARCIKGGKLQSEGLPWEESLLIMKVMDEVRRQGGLVYPEELESCEYPLNF